MLETIIITPKFKRLTVSLLILCSTLDVTFGDLLCSPPDNYLHFASRCGDSQYCCGEYNNLCCDKSRSSGVSSVMLDLIGVLLFLLIFIGFPICCYRCCCRSTTHGGTVYLPANNAGTSTQVTVNLPPQQLPYPTVVPHPQQTPYPPQYATNPYYNMPTPVYNQAAGMQQSASAPHYNM